MLTSHHFHLIAMYEYSMPDVAALMNNDRTINRHKPSSSVPLHSNYNLLKTRLPSNIGQTTRVHFRSRDKDGVTPFDPP